MWKWCSRYKVDFLAKLRADRKIQVNIIVIPCQRVGFQSCQNIVMMAFIMWQ